MAALGLTGAMPLVHHARRVLAQHAAGNPFADSAAMERTLRAVEAAYADPATGPRASRLLHVEADRLGDAIGAAAG